MFQACRPAGRLFYWVLAVGLAAPGVRLAAREVSARQPEKPIVSPRAKLHGEEPAPRAASPTPQSGPTPTSVVDTVYTADGTPAQGVLIITWPAFETASGAAVAAGNLNVTLGANGALNVGLVANAGANPSGVYYTVVYQLGPGAVRTETWVVPATSPATLAEVRTTPGAGSAAQPVSVQYVNSALAAKANDSAVVHLAGTETVTGTKTFSEPPNVPTPVGTGDVTNKAYVDSSIAAVGAGNYLPTAGGAMTGPLTLAGNPTAPLQAAAKQYVDSGLVVKADLISGLVPTSELGSGTASGLNCLLGSGAWGPCGSSANATAIQSVPVAAGTPGNGQVLTYSSTSGQYAPATPSGGAGSVSVTPSASQNIAQPLGTQFSVNNVSGIRYVTGSDNWSANPSGSLTGGTQATVTLSPCPLGIDTSGYSMYYAYVSGQGTSEPVMVTGGSCVAGAASGTIVFTPKNSHATGYKISSASSGIQEAINDGCGLPSGVNVGNPNARIILPATGALANALPVYGSIFAHCSRALIEGNGTLLSCSTRDRCMVLGDLVNSNHYGGVTLRGVNFTSTVKADGCQITNTQRQSNVVTITTASACSTIQNGDIVNINFTDNVAYWGNHGPVTVSGTAITYNQTGANVASTATPGTIAIENAAVEDNAMPGTMEDIKSSSGGGGNFNQFFVMDDDEAATIRNFDADGSQALTCTANHRGSYIYAANGGAPVLWLSHLNISPQCGGNGVTVYGNNSVRISDSVIQGFGMWGENTQTLMGGYEGTISDNVYMEEGAGPCPHPYNPGSGSLFSATGIMYQGNGAALKIQGGVQPAAHIPQFANTGSTQYNYYIIAHDGSFSTRALYAGFALTNGSGTITGQFPHIPPNAPGDTVTYDILRMQPSTIGANGQNSPVVGACTGGSPTTCGSIILSQAQCSSLLCTFTDTASANTSSYAIPPVNWAPNLPFWPAGLLIEGPNGSPIFTDTEPGALVSATQGGVPEVSVGQLSGGIQYGGVLEQYIGGYNSSGGYFGASLLNIENGAGSFTNPKGRLQFISAPGSAFAQQLLTLANCNQSKTFATYGYRPTGDSCDTWIGLDNSNAGLSGAQLALGAPVSISNYIGNIGDNASYLERLTASGKTFNVPVNINGNLTVTGTCTGCGGGGSGTVNSGTAAQVAIYSGNGAAVSGDGGLTDNGSTLTYTGGNGIAAASGTFSGNLTVNGQLLVAGPWTVSSPVPGTAMAAAGAGTSALGISNDGNFYISANGGSPKKVATTGTSSFFSNLFQEDASDLGEYNGTTPQGLNVYGTRADASDYERLTLAYDTVNTGFFKIDAQALGSGVHRGLAFWVNGAGRWGIDQLDMFKPFVDNAYDLGSTTFRVRNGYFGTGLGTPSLTLNGTALSNVIGTPSANLMTAGTVNGTGQPLCTDGTGNLTITTVGCPPGTGTIGGSGATSQMAYWTNTSGLGAAPVYVTGANTVEQYNGTNVQTFNFYGTYTNATNYERLSVAYVPGDTYYELQTQQGTGGGSQRGICFGVNNSCKWAVDTTTAFKPFNDNTRDIGTSTLRVRDFYLARNLIMSGTATTYDGKATAGMGLSPVYGAVSSTGLTAAVTSTTVCASATCGAGQYVVNYYLDSTVACTTPGSAAASLTIGWTDETSAKTLQVPLSGAGVSGGNSVSLGNTANFGNGTITLWSAGSTNITYSTSYTGCTTGTGTYALRLAVRQVQ
ncbi:MAG: hypothetical protein WB523_19290 [Candidatus Sulfotelmatobacter sp.]